MAQVKLTIRQNADNTLTVRVNRMVEHVGIEGKSKGEVFDAVKWALISKGLRFDDIEIVEELERAKR